MGREFQTLPWVVEWTSAPDLAGFTMDLARFNGSMEKRVVFRTGRDVSAFVYDVHVSRMREMFFASRRGSTAGRDTVVDTDFAWLYRLVETEAVNGLTLTCRRGRPKSLLRM